MSLPFPRYKAEILPKRCKAIYNQSILSDVNTISYPEKIKDQFASAPKMPRNVSDEIELEI